MGRVDLWRDKRQGGCGPLFFQSRGNYGGDMGYNLGGDFGGNKIDYGKRGGGSRCHGSMDDGVTTAQIELRFPDL
ncbi:hypothetical protein L1987_58126 [Smallanthus sonchifolius]|uniref:Uncharacterized protein n=1 Tax=Smallanthus sonchifolius TaxID=185202 RepID=A0ACB9DEX9_9ASTR|nr:hypothetical protein L1987_58126 [Smallanthus sonchifolius]